MFKRQKVFLSIIVGGLVLVSCLSDGQVESLCVQKEIPVTVIKFRDIGDLVILNGEKKSIEYLSEIKSGITSKYDLPTFDSSRLKVSRLAGGYVYFEYRPKVDCGNLVIFGIKKSSNILIEKCYEFNMSTHFVNESPIIALYKSIYFPSKNIDIVYTCEYKFDFNRIKVFTGLDDGNLMNGEFESN